MIFIKLSFRSNETQFDFSFYDFSKLLQRVICHVLDVQGKKNHFIS
jgi:hypothetical protein